MSEVKPENFSWGWAKVLTLNTISVRVIACLVVRCQLLIHEWRRLSFIR